MPGQRRYGMDHEYYEWSPAVTRGVLRWPDGARVALCVIVNLEHLEWNSPKGSYQSPTIAGGRGPRPSPNYLRFSHREYGHRVGIFRVLEALEGQGIKATVAMDALTAENYPYLVRYCLDHAGEIIGHGISVSRMMTSNMSDEEEREYIRASLAALTRATGRAPVGWMGPEYGESFRTPHLLREAGIQYVCDWANDDQPYLMKTKAGQMVSLPAMLDLDDVNALWDRRMPIDGYPRLLKEAFDGLYREGAENGRMMVINLHPWLIGQPFRVGFLEEVLNDMVHRQGVWAATGAEIVNWYRHHAAAGPPRFGSA
jgi:allantoinase